MKLVDILALELKVWPEGVVTAVQDLDGEVKFDNSHEMPRINSPKDVWIRQGNEGDCLYPKELAEDCSYAIVTRAQWQDAADALKAGEVSYSAENVSVNANYVAHTSSPVNAECKIVNPEWNGEGLPPVGTVCEYLEDGNGDWEEVTIVEIDHRLDYQFAVFHGDKGYSGDRRTELFRPIRTPEQITAEERETADIDAIHAFVLGRFGISDRDAAKDLYTRTKNLG